LTTALVSAFALPALAAPISAGSELSIDGPDTFTPTTITFTGLANVQGTGGDFNELSPCIACVTMIPSLSGSSTGTLYAVGDAGLSSALSLTGPVAIQNSGTAALPTITASGNGELTLSGFDPTPGEWTLTSQGGVANVTFSATAIPTGGGSNVVEPMSAAVLCSALLGLSAMRKRRG